MTNQQKTILHSLSKGNSIRYIGAIVAMIIGVATSFVSPLLLSGTIDALVSAVDGNTSANINLPQPLGEWFMQKGGISYLMSHLWIIALVVIFLYVFGSVFQYLRGRWTAQASENISKSIRDMLYEHLQELSYDYHVKAQTGDLIQRCTSDVDTIRNFLNSQLVEIFRAITMVTIALVIMLRINVTMTLYSMILVIPLFLFAYIFFKQVRKHFKIADEAEGKLSAVLQENLSGVRVVRAFGRANFETNKFDKYNNTLYSKNMKLIRLLSIYWCGSDGISLIQTGIAVVCGLFMVVASPQQLTVGEMVLFISYISMLLWPIRELGRILSDLGKAMVSFGRITEILQEPKEVDEEDAKEYPLDKDIEFRHVGFAYDDGVKVLDDINLTVKQGQTVAILGATGSGKSTLMHLLQRLYDATSGEILIGGVNIKKFKKKYLRSRVGLILQEPFLYSRSVKNNIGIVRRNFSDDTVYSAARVANAHDFINEFDKGYETMVGEKGVTLSGGQKQRVAIARTLLKDNDILIFDDSLSAVDTQTDRNIRQALNSKDIDGKKKTTTFIISHRLTTLAQADVIAVMQQGKITQLGTHEQLIKTPGLYKQIFDIQTLLKNESTAQSIEKDVK